MAEEKESEYKAIRPPPRFDIYGWEIKAKTAPNTERQDVKLPPGWDYAASRKTQQSLLQQRKKDNLPDISFDLDRDGKVGGQDLVIGKRFDLDKDGRLNTGERKAADEAVAGGIAQQFVWGVEQAAPSRPYRIMQKRGQIVDSEDFSKVSDTYPKQARSVSPMVKTTADLQAKRAHERLQSLKTHREDWDRRHPQQLIAESQNYEKSSLPYKTYSEKKELERREIRAKVGLSPLPKDINERIDPSLQYIPIPRYRSKSQMRTLKQADILQDLESKQNRSFLTSDQRLQQREEDLILPADTAPGKTYSEVKERLRKEANEHNQEVFGTVKVGIHGKDLPKFSEEIEEYWKEAKGYVEQPQIRSRLELEQRKKYWAPRDIYRLADTDTSPAPPDPFKSTHIPITHPSSPLPVKPTEHLPLPYQPKDLSDPSAPPPLKHTYRWTTLMQVFNRNLIRPEGRKAKVGFKSARLDE